MNLLLNFSPCNSMNPKPKVYPERMKLCRDDWTVVTVNVNIMKTTSELNFDFYQAFKQHGYTKIWKQR